MGLRHSGYDTGNDQARGAEAPGKVLDGLRETSGRCSAFGRFRLVTHLGLTVISPLNPFKIPCYGPIMGGGGRREVTDETP